MDFSCRHALEFSVWFHWLNSRSGGIEDLGGEENYQRGGRTERNHGTNVFIKMGST